MTAAAFCVVMTSGMPSSVMAFEPRPSAGSSSAILRARDSLAIRAFDTVALRGFVSCSCIFTRTSLTSGRSFVRSIAMAMACARVMVLVLLMLVPPSTSWGAPVASPLDKLIIHPLGRTCKVRTARLRFPPHFLHNSIKAWK